MPTPRTNSKLVKVRENLLRYATAASRRLLFAGIAGILALAAAVGLSGEGASLGDNLAGTLFFAVLLLASIAVSGYRHSIEFEARPSSIRIQSTMFGISLSKKALRHDPELGIVLRELRMLEPESIAPRSRALQGMLERRAAIFRLLVENQDGVQQIAESSDGDELAGVGKTVADFLGIPYRIERL